MFKKYFLGAVSLVALTFIFPSVSYAGALFNWNFGNNLLSCTGDYSATDTVNSAGESVTAVPCTSLCDILATASNLIDFGTTVILAFILPGMLLYGGLLIATAGASAGNLQKGRSVMWHAVIGYVIALSSVVLIKTFLFAIYASGTNQSYTSGGSTIDLSNWPNFNCNPVGLPGTLDLGQMRRPIETSTPPTATSNAVGSSLCQVGHVNATVPSCRAGVTCAQRGSECVGGCQDFPGSMECRVVRTTDINLGGSTGGSGQTSTSSTTPPTSNTSRCTPSCGSSMVCALGISGSYGCWPTCSGVNTRNCSGGQVCAIVGTQPTCVTR